jgi:hypothetical protein
MWAFTGVRDSTHLWKGHLNEAELDRRINLLLGGTQWALWLTEDLRPLHERSYGVHAEILG